MSPGVIASMTAVTCALMFGAARLGGESVRRSVGWALLVGFAIPYGVATLLWLAIGGAA